jgi:hypothetical protein
MYARRAPRRVAPAGLVPESLILAPAARTVGLLFSRPQFRFQSTSILLRRVLVPGLLAQFVGWTQLLIRTSRRAQHGNQRHTALYLYQRVFLASSEIFSWHVGIWFSNISRAGRIAGWGSVGEVFSAGSYTPRVFGFTCYERPWPRRIVRRPRFSVASMAFGPSACKRITNAAASATRTMDSKDRPERSGAESSGG